ncbi:nitrilase-related carbon-nitrogen hydrolase [Granulicella aggregans]|nr:nitrilase-related carbon-nitrogen hydrolase [Granulicella aggregans]
MFATAALLLVGNGMEPVWPLMWIAFVPVLWLATVVDSWIFTAGAAALAMLLGSLNMLYYLHFVLQAPMSAWLIPFSIAPLLFAGGVLLFRGLVLCGAVISATIALPAFWTVCEFIASFAPANGTAGSLAYTQMRFLPMLQLASITGPWGITFLLLMFPSAISAALYLRGQERLQLMVLCPMLAMLSGALLFGVVRLAAPGSEQRITVGLLDTDRVVFADDTATMRKLAIGYREEAERLARQGAEIVLMPEKTGLLLDDDAKSFDAVLQPVSDRTGTTLVIGVLHRTKQQSFNEARIYTPDQPVTTYDKQHLLPPFESKLAPGSSLALLPKLSVPVGIAICKDMDFVHPALNYGRAGIKLLLDPAWDFDVDRTWHGHIAIMRGVEGGYAIAHTAKDGFLTVSDDRGRILGEVRTDNGSFASLIANVPLRHDQTIFDRYGTWFPWVAGVFLIAAMIRLLFGLRTIFLAPTSSQ